MPLLFTHTECPACGHRHHFCLATDDLVPGREYEYVCPETAKKSTLRPTSAAERIHFPPQGAVALTPKVYDSPGVTPPAGANEPEAGPTRLQEVLPEVKDLAGKVGGLKKLSDIVETLKETKE